MMAYRVSRFPNHAVRARAKESSSQTSPSDNGAEPLNGKLNPPGQAIEGFLAYVDVAATTARTYEAAIRHFMKWLDECSFTPCLADLDEQIVKSFRTYLLRERAVNTAQTYMVALKQFCRYASRVGLLSRDPMDGLKGVRSPQGHLKRDLTCKELRTLFDAIDRNTEAGKLDYAMVNLMARNGLRIIEVHRGNVGDLETRQGRRILRVWGKGRDERDEFAVLSDTTEQVIDDYLSVRPSIRPSEPLFVNPRGSKNQGMRISTRHIRRRITRHMEAAGVKDVRTSVHSLRHSFITLAIESGASLLEVRAAARHRSVQTTLCYFHEHGRLENPIEDRIEI